MIAELVICSIVLRVACVLVKSSQVITKTDLSIANEWYQTPSPFPFPYSFSLTPVQSSFLPLPFRPLAFPLTFQRSCPSACLDRGCKYKSYFNPKPEKQQKG
ncbi:hypothetical protein F5Y16DRAFT_168745 [Xylariaceae sp. FL0255]|nr:hypothetical protein F5Y16DRAFT_168745 [Xylariaceae sp. FL0255]